MHALATGTRWVVALSLLSVILVAACQPKDLGFGVSDLPPGDPARGAELFTQRISGTTACQACHALDAGKSTGPSLHGYGTVAGTRVDGQDAATYTFTSIVRPAKHLVRGYSNVMPSDYADKLSHQEIADLIAYLLTL